MTMQTRSYLLLAGAAGIFLAAWNVGSIAVADGWSRLADLPLASWVMIGVASAFGVVCFFLATWMYPRRVKPTVPEAPA